MSTAIPSVSPSVASLNSYEIIIVGFGIVGSALAHSLSRSGRKVLAIERDLSKPDRIVGELLQPGGCLALKKLGLDQTLVDEEVGAVEEDGYQVFWEGKQVNIPYPEEFERMPWSKSGKFGEKVNGVSENGGDFPIKQQGRSFHHGSFVQSLRKHASSNNPNLTLLQATVTSLIKDPQLGHVLGVAARSTSTPPLAPSSSLTSLSTSKLPVDKEDNTYNFYAPLTIISDGCFSKFRRELSDAANATSVPTTRSHFVGLVLPNAKLPSPHHGHVILPSTTSQFETQKIGPILVYQLSQTPHETRMLIDVPIPNPENPNSPPSASKLPDILEKVVPKHLPASIVPSFLDSIRLARLAASTSSGNALPTPLPANVSASSLSSYRLRSMPNQYLPTSLTTLISTPGCFLVGDSLNMRHPLTGGGMTVGFSDAVILGELLGGKSEGESQVDVADWSEVVGCLEEWYERRKGVGICVNTLAMALYDLFSADDECLAVLRTGCFAYFLLGGSCVADPVALLSALRPSPSLLFYHFFSVAFYAIYLLFVPPEGSKKTVSVLDWPRLIWLAIRTLWKACVVFLPLMIREWN